jgi:tetratricopeptide (TPR) repeat protein/transcriptional regulator with XRE-family HTH domain
MDREKVPLTVRDSMAALSPFAILLRRYRDAAELTQEELAERSGVSVRAISDLERGVKSRPQRATVQFLGDGLGLTDSDRAALEATIRSRHRSSTHILRSLDMPVGGFLGSVPEGPLVARQREIDRVREVVGAARGGVGGLLFLWGEPGVGKTRLAQEATLICRASGMHVVTGRCYEPQQHVPFSPFVEVLSRLVKASRAMLGLDAIQRWPQLARLLPDEEPAGPPSGGEADQQRLFWAVSGLLEVLAGGMPLAVALDDLHWADDSSLALLQHLSAQLRHVPVLLLGTYREADLDGDHPLARVLRDLHREHLAEEIGVGRLNEEETTALIACTLGGDVHPALAHLVYHHTEGNAFFVQEIVRALAERGEALEEGGVWVYRAQREMAIPPTVQEAIRERLTRLSQPARAALEEASVLGQTFAFEELQAMSGRPEEDVEANLAEAANASVVRLAEGETYAFNHALTQLALYRELPPRRRKRLHLAAAGALALQSQPNQEQRAAELAWHFLEGGETDRAIPYAVVAGDQAEVRFAHQEAEQHYRSALHLAENQGDVALEAVVLERLGRVLTNDGQFGEARALLDRGVSMYRQLSNQEGETRVTVQLGSVHMGLGTPDAAIVMTESLLGRMEGNGPPEDIAELCIALEVLYNSVGRYRQALAVAERAAALAETSGDVAALARAETGRGIDLLSLGRLEEGILALESVIAVGEAAGDFYNLPRALEMAAIGYLARGLPNRSLEILQQSVALQERIQVPWGIGLALGNLGGTYRVLGEWGRAGGYLERGLALCRTQPFSSWAIYPLVGLARLRLDEGRLEKASASIQEALDIARQNGNRWAIGATELLRAEVDLLEGRPDSARTRVEAVLARLDPEEWQVLDALPALAAAHEAGEKLPKAEEAIEKAIDRARAQNVVLSLAPALVVRGRLMAAKRDWSEAERALEEAIQLAREMPCPYFEAQGLYESGSACAKRGDLPMARLSLEQSLPIFQRLGASLYVDRTEQALLEL